MLSQNIQALRKAKRLLQEELAASLHVVRQTVSKWEKGLSVPDAEMLIQIAQALDTTVNILLGKPVSPCENQPSMQDLAAQLEHLNARMARQAERRRKIWRAVSVFLAILAFLGITQTVLRLIHVYQANLALSSASIIGGADAPTAIYVSHISLQSRPIVLSLLAAAAAVIGLIRTRRK